MGESQESAQKPRLPPPEELQLLIIRELFIQIKCRDTSSIYIHGCHVTRLIYINSSAGHQPVLYLLLKIRVQGYQPVLFTMINVHVAHQCPII